MNYRFRYRCQLPPELIGPMFSQVDKIIDPVGFRFSGLEESALFIKRSRALLFNESALDQPWAIYLRNLEITETVNYPDHRRLEYLGDRFADSIQQPTPAGVVARPVRIAIIDTGVAPSAGVHASIVAKHAFCGSLAYPSDPCYDPKGHGTQIAAVVGGFTYRGVSYPGYCPGVQVIVAKTHGDHVDDVLVNSGIVESAICWAIELGAQVINVSLAFPRLIGSPHPLDPLVAALLSDEALFAAVGNGDYMKGDPLDPRVHGISAPASCAEALAVAGYDKLRMDHYPSPCKDTIAMPFCSGISSGIFAVAHPPQGVELTVFSKTSAATAHASGTACWLLANTPIVGAGKTWLRNILETICSSNKPGHWIDGTGGYGPIP
jgi:hypothetical protein